MQLSLSEFVSDFADALVEVDRQRIRHKEFQPGIGPFGEADAVRAAQKQLKVLKPQLYSTGVTRRQPDLLIPDRWAIEFKIIRPFGGNGKPTEPNS